MNSNRKYEVIVGANPPVQVYPINDAQIEFSQARDSDDHIFYIRKLKNKLKFSNNPKNSITDYTYFYGYESNANLKCSTFTLNIFKKCDGVFILDWVGEFGLTDASWDLDRCLVEVNPEPKTLYSCVKKNKNTEVNILDLPNIITTTANLDFNYEYFWCYDSPFFPPCNLPGVQTGTWTLAYQDLSRKLTYQCAIHNTPIRVYYREFVITACVGGTPQPPPGAGWALEQNNCNTTQTAKYVRVPISGPFPANQFGFGWWNYITNTQELPPEAVFKSVVVTATPASQTTFFLGHNKVVYPNGGTPQPTIKYKFEILNNANSTYVFSLAPGSPVPATITGAGNICEITPTMNLAGSIWVLLTETHGNGHVSTHTFIVQQVVVGPPILSQQISADITGPSTCCPSQQNLFFRCTQVPDFSTGNPTISWTASNGAAITAGQGTDQINVTAPASGSFTVQMNWFKTIAGAPQLSISCSAAVSVTVQPIPSTPPILCVDQAYPGETITLFTYSRSGSTWKAYRNTTALPNPTVFGPLTFLNTATPAVVGTYCYLFKESVNCVCNYVKIVPEQTNAAVSKLPALYWCSNAQTNNVQYTRNRLFKEVVEYVVDEIDCGITGVVSDFFGWNPVGDAPGYSAGNNYVLVNLGFPVTTNFLTNITIAQKSDIISYNSSNPATKGVITFDKLEKIWLFMFNAYWFIDSQNRLRIEHISYFNRTVAYNANVSPHAIFNVAKNKYNYDKTKMPKFEKFSMAEMMFTDFIGTSIYYDNLCVDQDSSSNTKERALDFITTDLYALFIDPASANKIGFVLMANNVVNNAYTVAVEQGVISAANITNGHLSWANLHNYYHRHNRVLIQGFMNNVLTTFASAKPTKVQKEIIIKFCCGNTFDPLIQLYKTELGDGILDEAEENTEKGTIKMTLLQQ